MFLLLSPKYVMSLVITYKLIKKKKNKHERINVTPQNPSHTKLDNIGEVQCCVPLVGKVLSVINQPHSGEIKMYLLPSS